MSDLLEVRGLTKEFPIRSAFLRRRLGTVPVAGTELVRLYAGIEHRVQVLADGEFEYAGARYRSLSMIARKITGTQWSGPLFFGLRKGGRR